MQQKPLRLTWKNVRGIAGLLLGTLLLLSAASDSIAQSGRRPPKRPASPDPLPPKQEEPPVKPSSTETSKPRIPVKVVWHLQDISSSTVYLRIVETGCLERLSQSGAISASPAEDLNRKRASDIAKASTDTYVLWFELEVDMAEAGRYGMGRVPPEYLYVTYEIFTPGTGKTKSSGRIYQRTRGPGGVPLPVPRTVSAEYSLRYAGREMADRLLAALGLPHPSERN